MADEATITLSATLMPEDIQLTEVAGTFTFTPSDADDKWFFNRVRVSSTSSDLIASNYVGDPLADGTASAAVSTSDKVKFLWIYNTGTTDGSSSSSDSVYIVIDGGTAANDAADAIEVPAGMTWYGKMPNQTVANIHAITGVANGGGTSSAVVECHLAGILDDV